jgi:hypothetical protein
MYKLIGKNKQNEIVVMTHRVSFAEKDFVTRQMFAISGVVDVKVEEES